MKIEKMASVANIVGLLPAAYCAYGTWVLLHPSPTQQAIVQSSTEAPSGSSRLIISLLIASVLIIPAAIFNAISFWRKGSGTTNKAGNGVPTPESVAFADEQTLIDELDRMPADEMKKKCNSDPEFLRRVNAIPINKYRSIPRDPSMPERFTDTLKKRVFSFAEQVHSFLKTTGQSPTFEAKAGVPDQQRFKDASDFHWSRGSSVARPLTPAVPERICRRSEAAARRVIGAQLVRYDIKSVSIPFEANLRRDSRYTQKIGDDGPRFRLSSSGEFFVFEVLRVNESQHCIAE